MNELIARQLSNNQSSIQVAKELFKQALAISITNYRVGDGATFSRAPRHQMYAVLLNRKQTMSIEAFVTDKGMREATEWVSTNSPIREFFNLLATNFTFLWYETDSKYNDFCRQLALSLAPTAPAPVTNVRQIAPLPDQVTDRMLTFTELHEQLKITKHLFAYTLFLLWADIDELSRTDETYNAIVASAPIIRRGRGAPPAQEAAAN